MIRSGFTTQLSNCLSDLLLILALTNDMQRQCVCMLEPTNLRGPSQGATELVDAQAEEVRFREAELN